MAPRIIPLFTFSDRTRLPADTIVALVHDVQEVVRGAIVHESQALVVEALTDRERRVAAYQVSPSKELLSLRPNKRSPTASQTSFYPPISRSPCCSASIHTSSTTDHLVRVIDPLSNTPTGCPTQELPREGQDCE